MVFTERINKCINSSNDIYELVANCFCILCDNIENHQLFVSKYIDEGENTNNPNISTLNKFSEDVMKLMSAYRPSRYSYVLDKILLLIKDIKLKKYMNEKMNKLTVIYCLISAIDATAVQWEMKWKSSTFGPLNKNKSRYKLYYNMHRVIHAEYIDNINRSRVESSDFFEQFENFRFLDTQRWISNNIPTIKFIPLRRNNGEKWENVKKLKIAVIPVSCNKNFEFVSADGSGVKVDYSKNDQDIVSDTVLTAMEKAIKEKCNIIVLPEYVSSPNVKRIIKSKLQENDQKDNLLLIFAGTTWTNRNNNVIQILDPWGDEIGKYYKYSPFTRKKRGRHGYEVHEALNDPGKVCDIFAVENIGVFVPAICRDAIDGEYTELLLRIFHPAFVVISAWSPSVQTFIKREKEFANRYFVNSIMANACSAVASGNRNIGNGCIVARKGTIADSKEEYICRMNCEADCDEQQCVYIIDYDYTKALDPQIMVYNV